MECIKRRNVWGVAWHIWLRAVFLLWTAIPGLVVPQQHPVSVEDCVSLQRIYDGPAMSRDGAWVAFVTKSPNVIDDRNVYRLRLRSLRDRGKVSNGSILLSSFDPISSLHFVKEGERLSVLINRSDQSRKPGRIIVMNLVGNEVGNDLSEQQGISDYSISEDGNTVAYVSPIPPSASDAPFLDGRMMSRGFHIPDNYYDKVLWSKGIVSVGKYALWIAHRKGSKVSWQRSRVKPPPDAMSPGLISNEFEYAYDPSFAPDGKYLAFGYRLLNPSEHWMESRTVVAYRDDFGVPPLGIAVYDIQNRKFLDVPEIPFPVSSVSWSDDSSAFALLSAAPIGSRWDSQDTKAHTKPRDPESFHFFAINVSTREVSEVLSSEQAKDAPSVISWKGADNDLLIQTNRGGRITANLTLHGDEWKEKMSIQGSVHRNLTSSTTSDGDQIVGIYQDSKHPPDLWYTEISKPGADVQLTNLNPSVSGYTLGDLADIEWINKYGVTLRGKLITPPNPSRATRYPLVIMLTWPDEEFVCDGHYTTAFPPQPLASVGIAVAMFNIYDAFGVGGNQPSGPPQTREAESMDASIESLISFLDKKGIILKDDVGIIGFSRSSWKVDYFITHSKFRMRAASSADGGLGNYGDLWTTDVGSSSGEVAKSYGGLFFGTSRSAWLVGAPAFNADKVLTPLLMEYTGAGGRLDEPSGAYEFHSALVGLRKPVDLFFYPQGSHPLDTPFERVASLQRNVDWFRFWMQGYEGKAPDYDPEEYFRWRHLRDLQNAEDNTSIQAPDSVSKPN